MWLYSPIYIIVYISYRCICIYNYIYIYIDNYIYLYYIYTYGFETVSPLDFQRLPQHQNFGGLV